MSLVDHVVDAHGGLERWRGARAVTMRLSSGGLAFAAKGQRRALHDLRATIRTTGQAVDLEAPGWSRSFESGIPRPSGIRWSVDSIAASLPLPSGPTWPSPSRCRIWTWRKLTSA